jgi:hypothetical protein
MIVERAATGKQPGKIQTEPEQRAQSEMRKHGCLPGTAG